MRFDIVGFTCEKCGRTQREDVTCPQCGAFENWIDDLGIHESKDEILEDLKEGVQLLKEGDPLAKRYFVALHRTYALITPRQRTSWFDLSVHRAMARAGMPLDKKIATPAPRKKKQKKKGR